MALAVGAWLRWSAAGRNAVAMPATSRLATFLLADPVVRAVLFGLVAIIVLNLLAADQLMWATNVTE